MGDKYIRRCPYCGAAEFVETKNFYKGATSVSPVNNPFKAAPIFYTVCAECGSVVRTYVNNPEKLK